MDAAARQAVDDLKRSVHQLTQAVSDWRDRSVDESTVRSIVADAVERSRRVGQGVAGYQPEDGGRLRGDVDLEPLPAHGRQRLEMLHELGPTEAARRTGIPTERLRAWQTSADRLLLAQAYMAANGRDDLASPDPRQLRLYGGYRLLTQAMDSTTTAEGDEFVPRSLSGSLLERVTLELQVAALFPTIEMPTNPFDLPGVSVARARGGKATEQTGDTGQTKFKLVTPATRAVTLTAAKFATRVLVSRELEEDSLIAVLPFVETELVDTTSADIEDCVVNGDTTGTHQDSDTTASDDPRKNFDGLRKLAPAGAKTDASNAALTAAMLRTNRKKMGKYGARSSDLAHVVGIAGYVALLSDSNLQTVDKYGPAATLLAGELGKVDGAPVIVSEYVRQDLNASGVHDGTTTNRSVALTVNRRGFLVGNRRGVTVQVLRELYAESDQDCIVVTARKAFAARYPSTEAIVATHYNLST